MGNKNKNKKDGKKDKSGKKSDKGSTRTKAAVITAVAEILAEPVAERPPLRDVQNTLKQRYRDNPEAASITSAIFSTTTRSATPDADDPTRVQITVDSPAGAIFEIGAHVAVGGLDDLACSGDVFLASLAACQELTIRLVAAAMGIELRHLELRVEGDWDARGTLAVSREAPIGFTAIRILVDLDVDAPQDKIARMLRSAERFCVVSATLKDAPPVHLIPTVRGEVIPTVVT